MGISVKLSPLENTEIPFFSYGCFQPDELAYRRVEPYLDGKPAPAVAAGAPYARGGLPLFKGPVKAPVAHLRICWPSRIPRQHISKAGALHFIRLRYSNARVKVPDHIRGFYLLPSPTSKMPNVRPWHSCNQVSVLCKRCIRGSLYFSLDFILNIDSLTGQLICLDGGQHLAWKTPDILGVE